MRAQWLRLLKNSKSALTPEDIAIANKYWQESLAEVVAKFNRSVGARGEAKVLIATSAAGGSGASADGGAGASEPTNTFGTKDTLGYIARYLVPCEQAALVRVSKSIKTEHTDSPKVAELRKSKLMALKNF